MKVKKLKRVGGFEFFAHIVLFLWTIICIYPFLVLIMSAVSSETSIARFGYSVFPHQFSLNALDYLFKHRSSILNAYKITAIVTIIGTTGCLFITSTLAYALSRIETPFRRTVNFLVFFSLLFNGGLVPTYLIWTQVFHVGNTIWALIFPSLLCNGFYVIIVRNYYKTSVHPAIIEAAKIDGAGEFRTFFQVAMPLSIPILATVGLFSGLAYWNDWQNGLYYVRDPNLFSIQYLLNKMIEDVRFLSSGTINAGSAGAEQLSRLPTTTIKMAVAVIGILPILIVYPFFQRYFAKGIAIGAVKG